MTDIAIIILTKDEKLHIGRCLERIAALSPRQVFVVDCFSTDGTQEQVTNTSASLRLCVKTIEHEWPGNQAAQFQWALDNLPIEAKWILRLDADEYLYVGNQKTKTFHWWNCQSVKSMSDNNKVYFHTREEAIADGYKPCGSCNP